MGAKTPEELLKTFQDAMNSGDPDAVIKCYEPTGILVPPGADAVSGPDGIRGGVGPFIAANAKINLHAQKVMIAGDIAVMYDDWTATMDGPDGKRVDLAGKAIEVCHRQSDGSWLFVFDDATARG
jgi:uncharacterized protein (TIGR02246 family)